jgi:hypothetical protein
LPGVSMPGVPMPGGCGPGSLVCQHWWHAGGACGVASWGQMWPVMWVRAPCHPPAWHPPWALVHQCQVPGGCPSQPCLDRIWTEHPSSLALLHLVRRASGVFGIGWPPLCSPPCAAPLVQPPPLAWCPNPSHLGCCPSFGTSAGQLVCHCSAPILPCCSFQHHVQALLARAGWPWHP